MSTLSDSQISLLSSSSSGILSRLLCHPLDTLKSRLQSPTNPSRTFLLSLTSLLSTHGPSGLYRGLPASLIGGTPGTILYLQSYDLTKSHLTSSTSLPPSLIHLTSGIIAEIISCIIYVPVDVTKERLQISTLSNEKLYKGSFDCLKKIIENEGIKGIYKGYGGTVASFGPFSGMYFLGYEKLKSTVRENNYYSSGVSKPAIGDVELTFNETLTCSLTAGAGASWVTTPLDLAKLRMQVSNSKLMDKDMKEKYRTFGRSLKSIFRDEGVRGLWRGGMARVAFFTPATGITMGTYDWFKGILKDM